MLTPMLMWAQMILKKVLTTGWSFKTVFRDFFHTEPEMQKTNYQWRFRKCFFWNPKNLKLHFSERPGAFNHYWKMSERNNILQSLTYTSGSRRTIKIDLKICFPIIVTCVEDIERTRIDRKYAWEHKLVLYWHTSIPLICHFFYTGKIFGK